MNRFLILTVISALFAIASSAQISLKIGSPAPAFTGASLEGTEFDLDRLRGSVVVMTFWSTRCAICHHELPRLNAMADRFKGERVFLLALSMENEDIIKGYLKKNSFKFRVLPNSFGTVLAYADRGKNGNLDMGFPAFYFLDQNGVVRHRSSGYDKTDGVATAVDKLLR